MAKKTASVTPNSFQLMGDGVLVNYSVTSIDSGTTCLRVVNGEFAHKL